MKNVSMQRHVRILVMVSALMLGVAGAASAQSDSVARNCPAAEIFATDNTAIITDPDDSRLTRHLTRFDHEVHGIIRSNGATSGVSSLLDGVFWSAGRQQVTYERSRAFDVRNISRGGLHHVADLIAKQYDQESVLTFRCLRRTSPESDAAEVLAPGVSRTRLHDALVNSREARTRLGGGSITPDGQLILIAPLADLRLAREFAAGLGVDRHRTEIHYGDEEFVS
ncbi:hypothetical protein [Streptomyces sp. NBC_00859]|uniref:hypothetical protein n=1 Tax=Streptomyces sp. NBC_00859 TaxID=2903682 RepID=UPI00386465D5|nr:hypothetical protein OG584_33980 [Streptomyces sp. NBC_00859]